MKLFTLVLFILTSIPSDVTGQIKQTKFYSALNRTYSLCSESIILDSAGYFFHKWGCEGQANISFGKYKLRRNNVVDFYFLPFDSLSAVKKIVQEPSSKNEDSSITITFYDRFKKPITLFFGIWVADTTGKVHEMMSDKNGQLKLNRFFYKNLTLTQFFTLYQKAQNIPVDIKSLNIYLNLPEMFLIYPEITLDKKAKLNLQMKRDGLYTPNTKQKVFKIN